MSAPSRTPLRRLAATAATLPVLITAAACGGDRPADQAPAARDPNAPLHVVEAGLSTPESVLWDSARAVWYITNINGSPLAKDDNGYIVRVGPDGAKLDSLPLINGADDDITLHAPKGMALQGDTLWVADIDALRGFNVMTGMPVASIELGARGAMFLNDVAVGSEGEIYITDSGFRFDDAGNAVHAGTSGVFEVRNRVARRVLTLPKGSGANGIAWDRARNAWAIVGFNTPTVFSWVRSAQQATELGAGPGGGDGLLVFDDGRMLFSSWADSSLTLFAGGEATTLRRNLPGPADLGYDPARRLIAVPLFTSNRVEFWPLDSATSPPTGN